MSCEIGGSPPGVLIRKERGCGAAGRESGSNSMLVFDGQGALVNGPEETTPGAAEAWLRKRYPEMARGADMPDGPIGAIKRAFAVIFAPWELALPDRNVALRQSGQVTGGGWRIEYRFGNDGGREYIEFFASHRMTNDRLYRIHADGEIELIGASLDGLASLNEETRQRERAFSELLREHGFAG